jgi:hypothetical protein
MVSILEKRQARERRYRLDDALWDRALKEVRHPTTTAARMHLARSILGAEMLFRDECCPPRLALAFELVGQAGILQVVDDFNRLMGPPDPFVFYVLQLRGTPPTYYLTTRSQQQTLTFCLRRLDSDAPESLSDHQHSARRSGSNN